jgi:Protein of unknown function (DUF2384)
LKKITGYVRLEICWQGNFHKINLRGFCGFLLLYSCRELRRSIMSAPKGSGRLSKGRTAAPVASKKKRKAAVDAGQVVRVEKIKELGGGEFVGRFSLDTLDAEDSAKGRQVGTSDLLYVDASVISGGLADLGAVHLRELFPAEKPVEVANAARKLGITAPTLLGVAGIRRTKGSSSSASAKLDPEGRNRVQEMLEIVSRISDWAGGTKQALAWYRAAPLPAFGGRTAEALVKEGKAPAVRDFLDHIALGGFA